VYAQARVAFKSRDASLARLERYKSMPELGRSLFSRVQQRSLRHQSRPIDGSIRKRRGTCREWDLEAALPPSKVLQRDATHSMQDNPSKQGSYQSLAAIDEDSFKDRLEEEKDKYFEERRDSLGDNFDEDDVGQEFVKKRLLETYTNAEVRMTAESLIDESWLGNVDALPGNIYRLAVMGDIFDKADRTASLLEKVQIYAKMWGLFIIVLIQVLGPPMIFLSRMFGFGVLQEQQYKWECCPWYRYMHPTMTLDAQQSEIVCGYEGTHPSEVSMFDDWAHIKSTKAMGLLMMTAFILNGLFVLLDERNSWKQIYNTFRYLDVMNSRFKLKGMSFLYLDSCLNCWVITWSCLDVFLVIGASENPSDVLMNALSLMFLYNLDDIGGDFGFVDVDDWPGARLAWIYKEIVKPCPDDQFDEDKLDFGGSFALSIYGFSLCVLAVYLFVLPLLATITPFNQIVS